MVGGCLTVSCPLLAIWARADLLLHKSTSKMSNSIDRVECVCVCLCVCMCVCVCVCVCVFVLCAAPEPALAPPRAAPRAAAPSSHMRASEHRRYHPLSLLSESGEQGCGWGASAHHLQRVSVYVVNTTTTTTRGLRSLPQTSAWQQRAGERLSAHGGLKE